MQWKAAADELRQIDLKTILPLLDAVADRYDSSKWHTHQGVISVTGQKFINWNQGCGGGGAIDLVMHLKQCDFKTALRWLWEHFPYAQHSNLVCHAPFRPLLRLLSADSSKLPRVTDYLVAHRRIDPYLVRILLDSKTLYADNRGNAVFLLLGKEKKVVGGELRGTTSVPWRGMAPGSRKDLGYFSIQRCKTSSVMLCESAIDALSYVTMLPDAMAISTSGATPNPGWLQSLTNDQTLTVFCGFDSDPTGDRMAQQMIRIHPTIKRIRPAKKDWNDVLVSAENPANSMAQFN